jgi:hypothetical protein
MSNPLVSRRGFFRHAAGATAAGATTGQSVPSPPSRAWTILGINWEYNDEFCYEAGEFIEPTVYFDEQEAIAACQKLTAAFFGESPQEFQPCWHVYEVDPDTATWDDLRQAGFPDPYSVKELEAGSSPGSSDR